MRNFPTEGCISENYCTPFCAENAGGLAFLRERIALHPLLRRKCTPLKFY